MYYLSEVQTGGIYRKAVKLNAQTLHGAKIEATKRSIFYDTVLMIGTKLSNDFLDDDYIVASKNINWTTY